MVCRAEYGWRACRLSGAGILLILAAGISAHGSAERSRSNHSPVDQIGNKSRDTAPGYVSLALSARRSGMFRTALVKQSWITYPLKHLPGPRKVALPEAETAWSMRSGESIISQPLFDPLAFAMPFVAIHATIDQVAPVVRWHTFSDTVDASLFLPAENDVSLSFWLSAPVRKLGEFRGIGFPHIETGNRADSDRYQPFSQLITYRQPDSDMRGVRTIAYVRCMGLNAEAVAKRAERYDRLILSYAIKHGISASLIKAVVAKESCFKPTAISHAGAMGLMQLMPDTARWLQVQDPLNPQQNLAAGIRYLADLRKRFGSNELALAAYNAGPGNVRRFNGIPPFAETQTYVKRVMHYYRGYVAANRHANIE